MAAHSVSITLSNKLNKNPKTVSGEPVCADYYSKKNSKLEILNIALRCVVSKGHGEEEHC